MSSGRQGREGGGASGSRAAHGGGGGGAQEVALLSSIGARKWLRPWGVDAPTQPMPRARPRPSRGWPSSRT
eukprot:195030-Pyramimonas_sp.AAC.1